jgi:predicted amidophosphoribosyltransferase
MKCKACGKEIDRGAFCEKCAEELNRINLFLGDLFGEPYLDKTEDK